MGKRAGECLRAFSLGICDRGQLGGSAANLDTARAQRLWCFAGQIDVQQAVFMQRARDAHMIGKGKAAQGLGEAAGAENPESVGINVDGPAEPGLARATEEFDDLLMGCIE